MTPALRFAPGAVAALALTVVFAAGCTDGGQPEAAESVIDGDIGAEVYANNCASCHGANLEGTDKGPSQLSIVYEPNHHTDESYRAAIANGAPQHHWDFGDMPPVEGLTTDQVEAVIDFIRSEQERQGLQR